MLQIPTAIHIPTPILAHMRSPCPTDRARCPGRPTSHRRSNSGCPTGRRASRTARRNASAHVQDMAAQSVRPTVVTVSARSQLAHASAASSTAAAGTASIPREAKCRQEKKTILTLFRIRRMLAGRLAREAVKAGKIGARFGSTSGPTAGKHHIALRVAFRYAQGPQGSCCCQE